MDPDADPGGPETYMDPTDPDPQHDSGSATLIQTITLTSPPSFPLLDTVRSVGTELPVVSELFLLAGVGGADPLLSDEDILWWDS
jgi:hypothetical protein